ncbi:MAG: hypothetical protein VX278_09415 [Myxococcota bacterium]|nr:hypothetical protein [Myxococcota bacterium]
MKPKLLLFHGKEGSPNGRKATHLKKNPKYVTRVPSYPSNKGSKDAVFPRCYEIAQKNLQEFEPDIVIGSSFGGGILLQLITDGLWRGPSLFLAQAGYMYNIANHLPKDVPAILVHGTADRVVPILGSQVLAQSSPNAHLIQNAENHSLPTLCDGLFEACIDLLWLKR